MYLNHIRCRAIHELPLQRNTVRLRQDAINRRLYNNQSLRITNYEFRLAVLVMLMRSLSWRRVCAKVRSLWWSWVILSQL